MLNSSRCWKGNTSRVGLEVLLPPYPVLHGSSIWLLLSCILNNKAVTSPYRFQHMDSVPRTCTYTEIKYHFVFYSIAHTGFKPSPASSDQSFNYPKYCVLPSQLSSSLEASEQEKKNVFHYQDTAISLSLISPV